MKESKLAFLGIFLVLHLVGLLNCITFFASINCRKEACFTLTMFVSPFQKFTENGWYWTQIDVRRVNGSTQVPSRGNFTREYSPTPKHSRDNRVESVKEERKIQL